MPGSVPPLGPVRAFFVNRQSQANLTPPEPAPTPIPVSRPDGRPGYARKGAGEESPGSMDERCRITSGGAALHGDASGKVPQKTDRLGRVVYWLKVRVKRWGKSPPRLSAMTAARQTPPGAKPNRNGVSGANALGPSGPVIRVGCLRRRATGVPEEWPSRLPSEASHTKPGLQAG